MTKVSLTALQAAREAMTSGEYRYDQGGWIESMDRGLNHSGSETEVLILGRRDEPADGIGIVDEHNAMPVLLRLARAAAAWRDAECDDDPRCSHPAHRGNCPVVKANQALLAALAEGLEVEP